MICFLGSSHAAEHLREAAHAKGVPLTNDPEAADVIFISEDTPTSDKGDRNLFPIHFLIEKAKTTGAILVLTSQVPPGFTRSLGISNIFHQAETLRIKDATYRALNPDYIVIGCPAYISYDLLPSAYRMYLDVFNCPKFPVTYEDAEFSKIAVNMTLAAQVESANKLSVAAHKCGASWWHVAEVLRMDKRIGKESYLTPGRWQDSKHLLRDYVTLEALSTR